MTFDDPQSGSDQQPEFDSRPDAFPAAPQSGPPDAAPPASGSGKISRRKRVLVGVGGAALAAALVVTGVGIGQVTSSTNGVGTAAQAPVSGGSSSTGTGTGGSGSSSSAGGAPFGNFPHSTQGSEAAQTGTAATSTQQSGIVTVVSVLGYEDAESAGTGMILTSDGEILTNNHVINGATSVTVTVESTGKSYRADVVGTDPTDDIAVLQLRKASGLTTAKIGDSSSVAVGDSVVGVGNGGGTGTLTSAAGKVTALKQAITATDDSGSNAEHLTGLIETNAAIVAGDSGGPLYDSAGEIIGIDTAASSTSGEQTAAATTAQAYAIPIDNALKIAEQIESGVETASIHIGLPAFLGVEVASTGTGGAGIAAVVSGGPAADAGITAGSVITAVGGKSVATARALQTRLATYAPGAKVSISWTSTYGASHTATITLIGGAAD